MYICSNCIFVIHIPYILYTVTYTLHYIIAYMAILQFYDGKYGNIMVNIYGIIL